MTTHCDIGISPKMAAVLGQKPTIDYLCDDYSDGGDSIRGYDIDFDWILPAAVDCPKCIKVRDLWRNGMTLRQARKAAKKEAVFQNEQTEKSMSTRIFRYRPKSVDGQIIDQEDELEFIRWTPQFLIVKYPPGSLKAGQDWKLGRSLVNNWLKLGTLRIEGEIPDWALVI